MSRAGHLTATRGVLFVELCFRGLSAFGYDGIKPQLRFKWYVVVLCIGFQIKYEIDQMIYNA